MITAEVQLLDSAVLARIARILEIELTYLQNELNTVSTQAALVSCHTLKVNLAIYLTHEMTMYPRSGALHFSA